MTPDTLSGQTLRIIDANLNRIGEGLRLLEDIARLLLSDSELTQQLKNIRHDILEHDLSFNIKLLQARNAEEDVGINLKAVRQKDKKDLPLVVVANSRRVQESLRVLEELAKTTPDLDTDKLRQARFELYTIEQALTAKLLRQDKTKQIAGLQFILDTKGLETREAVELAKKAIASGAKAIHLINKDTSKRELLKAALKLSKVCSDSNILFIVGESLDIALAAQSDGIQLEQDSLPVQVMRKLVPVDMLLGHFVKTEKQAVIAQSEGADYISFNVSSSVDLKTLRKIKKAVALPVLAMGAINVDNVREIVSAGADATGLYITNNKDFEKEAGLIAKLYKQQ